MTLRRAIVTADGVTYIDLSPEEEAARMSEEQAAAAAPMLIRKAIIIDRLQQAGLLEAARAALDGADLYTRERWNARDAIYADDQTARALLSAIGADPDVILAP